ncbi:hypothetical protein BJY52DRAFT_1425670 [Lactarius psammicola]|nr:hypothetical protein BJY52DRAFT_1425670 [Lactarius psammicola]
MTTDIDCRAFYNSHLDRSTAYDPLGISGSENGDPQGSSGPEIGDLNQDHAHQDNTPFIERFPSGLAGAPISNMGQTTPGFQAPQDYLSTENIWSPFRSQRDWDFALWAKNRGPTSTAVTELLTIDGVVKNLGLSYRNTRELNRIIDEEMPGRPKFKSEAIHFDGESFDFYFRDIIPCIRALFGDPAFARRLAFAPEFSEMHTGKWWCPGVTVVPVIISSDKTQLTLFRSKSAYPVYMSIGNIPKDIRCKPTQRAQMLMGYIPTTRLEHITNKAAQHRALANLFHACMRRILSPIETYGETGIEMATSDGIWYRCHPILATFIGDYPEQSLVTCTFNGRCPKCIVPRDELGNYESFPLRDIRTAIDVYSLCDSDPTTFNAVSHEAGLKPIYHPFWEHLPYTNIFLSITPDILHQLHQGIAKHLVRWLGILGSEEINARCSRLPPNHNARHFHKGITRLSRLSGQEHKDICRIILRVVVDLTLPGIQSSARLTHAVRALLDFFYLSQYPVHTTESLNALETALRRFHEEKEVFIELGVREHFNFPKLHSLAHYRRSIMLFGSADNYNTEQSERLHIDFTKNAYRTTNFKDEYKQMTTWLERQEAMHQRTALIELRNNSPTLSMQPSARYPSLPSTLHPFLTTHPSEKGVSFDSLANRYGAIDFQDTLADFIVQHNYPELSASAARRRADNTLIPFQRVSVFHKIRFANRDDSDKRTVDAIHIRPEARNKRGIVNPGRFDTGLVKNGSRIRVVQIRVVFQFSISTASSVFLASCPAPPAHLAYVEWFSPPSPPGPSHNMCRISRNYRNGRRSASIIPLTDVCRSVQLFPVFGPVAPRHWQGTTVLEECNSFYVNPFLDRHMYQNFSVISGNF